MSHSESSFAALKRTLFVEMTVTFILLLGLMAAGATANLWLLPLVRMVPGQANQLMAFIGILTVITVWIWLYTVMYRRSARHFEEFRAHIMARAEAEKPAGA